MIIRSILLDFGSWGRTKLSEKAWGSSIKGHLSRKKYPPSQKCLSFFAGLQRSRQLGFLPVPLPAPAFSYSFGLRSFADPHQSSIGI